MMRITPDELMVIIQKCLTPDLLKKEYRAENASNPMFGHCYVASEVLYHKIKPYGDYSAACGRDPNGIVHWWIVDNLTGERYDTTADQYLSKGLTPPYDVGRKTGFLTKLPSKRAKIVLARMTNL
jgi:hypothetical protein